MKSSFPKTELNRLSQAYQSLSKKGLVKRLRKEHYLINPDALFYSKTYKEVKQRWESISKKPAKQ
jgi:DNA-binding transcriptional regulator YhcF (GntR family)